MHVFICLIVLVSSCLSLEDNYVPFEDVADNFHEGYEYDKEGPDAKSSVMEGKCTPPSVRLEDVKSALKRILSDRVIDEFTTSPVNMQIRELRDNKHRADQTHRHHLDKPSRSDVIEHFIKSNNQVGPKKKLPRQILHEYNENSKIENSVTNAKENYMNEFHLGEIYPDHFGKIKNSHERMHESHTWYNHFPEIKDPSRIIDKLWKDDTSGEISLQDGMIKDHMPIMDSFDNLTKSNARDSFIRQILNEYDIPDYYNRIVKIPSRDKIDVVKDFSKQPQESQDHSDELENSNKQQDSANELETGFRRILQNEKKKDQNWDQKKEQKWKPKATWKNEIAHSISTREIITTVASLYNFDPKIFKLSNTTKKPVIRTNWPSRSSERNTQITSSTKLNNKGVYPITAEYYEPKTSKYTATSRSMEEYMYEANFLDLYTEPDLYGKGTKKSIVPSNSVSNVQGHQDISPPATLPTAVQSETVTLTGIKENLTPLKYYQYPGFIPKIIPTKTRDTIITPTQVIGNISNDAIDLYGNKYSPYNPSQLLANDLITEPIHLGIFKSKAEHTLDHSANESIHLGIFKSHPERTLDPSANNSIHLEIFKLHPERTLDHSTNESNNLAIFRSHPEITLDPSANDSIHLGIFKSHAKHPLDSNKDESVHLDILKSVAEKTTAASTGDHIRLGIFKSNVELTTVDETSTSPTEYSSLMTTASATETITSFPAVNTSTVRILQVKTVEKKKNLMANNRGTTKILGTNNQPVSKPYKSKVFLRTDITVIPDMPDKPKMDLQNFIPSLVDILGDIAKDKSGVDLVKKFNETIQAQTIPTCPPEMETTTSTTTVTTTMRHYDYDDNVTGTIMGKCFVCGLEDKAIPYEAVCSDGFGSDFMGVLPFNPTFAGKMKGYRRYCRYMDVFTGGCSVRWSDITPVYTQRACRNKHRPMLGKSYASKRMAKLEKALYNVDNGCIVSPMATLLPLSRGISLFSKFTACVCTGSWCNKAYVTEPWMRYFIVPSLMSFIMSLQRFISSLVSEG